MLYMEMCVRGGFLAYCVNFEYDVTRLLYH